MGAKTTKLMTAAGQFEVRGTYEDIKIMCAPRQMQADTGMREFIKADGTKCTIALGAIIGYDEAPAEIEKNPIGFR